MNCRIKGINTIMIFSISIICCATIFGSELHEDSPIAKQSQSISDNDGKVTVTCEWLKRPGEMALTIDYYGYLIQEGMVNFYIEVNGEQREFLTMIKELPDRSQRVRLISFHPIRKKMEKGISALKKLEDHTLVDHLLFRNAPYYSALGKVRIELKFFAHGRWDGDSKKDNGNFVFEFTSPLKGDVFHF